MDQQAAVPEVQKAERYSLVNLAANGKTTHFVRIITAIFVGCLSGIIGLSWWQGFLAFASSALVVPLVVIIGAGFRPSTFYISWQQYTTEGMMGGLMSFILFWTLAFTIVHIY